MNVKQQPIPTLKHISELPPGTAFQAFGGFWIITNEHREPGDKQLIVNVLTGETRYEAPLATVIPEYGRFTLEGRQARNGYILGMRVLQSDLLLDDEERAAMESFIKGASKAVMFGDEGAPTVGPRVLEQHEALKDLYQKYVVEYHGENVCDCDPSVGINECAPCKARAALGLKGGSHEV